METIDFSEDIPRAYALTNQRRLVVIVTNRHVMLIDTRDVLGRLKPDWIKTLTPVTYPLQFFLQGVGIMLYFFRGIEP